MIAHPRHRHKLLGEVSIQLHALPAVIDAVVVIPSLRDLLRMKLCRHERVLLALDGGHEVLVGVGVVGGRGDLPGFLEGWV